MAYVCDDLYGDDEDWGQCVHCGDRINENESYWLRDDGTWCESCYREKFLVTCAGCSTEYDKEDMASPDYCWGCWTEEDDVDMLPL